MLNLCSADAVGTVCVVYHRRPARDSIFAVLVKARVDSCGRETGYQCSQLSMLIITSDLETNEIEPRSYLIIPC